MRPPFPSAVIFALPLFLLIPACQTGSARFGPALQEVSGPAVFRHTQIPALDPRQHRTTALALEARQIVEKSRGEGLSSSGAVVTLSGTPLRTRSGRFSYWPKLRGGSPGGARSSRGFGTRYVIPAEDLGALPRRGNSAPSSGSSLFPANPGSP